MELNPDVLRMLALELDLPSIVKFCKTNKTVNRVVCENNTFWRNKLYKDFPDALVDIPQGANYEKIYKTVKNNDWTYFYVYKFPSRRGKLPQMSDLGKTYGEIREANDILVRGRYPIGTKFWVYYGDNIVFRNGFFGTEATKEKAIDKLIEYLHKIIDPDYYTQKFLQKGSFEEYYGLSVQELRECLNKNLSCQIETSKGQTDFMIKQFTVNK